MKNVILIVQLVAQKTHFFENNGKVILLSQLVAQEDHF